MKKILKILLIIILIPYIISVAFLTICLLNFNKYGITELGDNTFVIINDEEIEDYNKGDLVIVPKTDNNDISINDHIFFYNTEAEENVINYAQITNKEIVTETETTFEIGREFRLSSEFVIGKAENGKVYPTVGGILGALESRWGFLFYVIFPVLIIFIFEIYVLIKEIKERNEEPEEIEQ